MRWRQAGGRQRDGERGRESLFGLRRNNGWRIISPRRPPLGDGMHEAPEFIRGYAPYAECGGVSQDDALMNEA